MTEADTRTRVRARANAHRRRGPLSALALALALALAFASPAQAETPERNGFTLEFGIGVGIIEVDGLPGRDGALLDIGMEPHAISLGAFLTPRLALMYRWTSTYYFATNADGDTAQGVLGTHGVHLQYWWSERWFVAGGVAAAFFGNVIGRSDRDPDIAVGFGAVARVGFALANWRNHSLRLSVEAMLGAFAHRVVGGQTMNLEYQWF